MIRSMHKKRDRTDRDRFSSRSFRGKKGQITVFIILGIVLLLAVVLVILYQQEIVTFKPEELIPTEKGKVETFLTSCIGEIGEEALFLVGLHAGYLEVPPEILNDGWQHLKLSPDQVVPFWARGETVRIPSLDLIKDDIDHYIEENLRECLLGEGAFEETYNLIEKSSINSDTQILDKKVLFNVNWDVEIKDKAGEIISEVEKHTAESNIKLKRVYEMARAVVEREMAELKLERLTIDLISLDHPKVPVSGVDMDCNGKSWKVNEARETLQDMLRVNTRALKVKGADFVEFPDELPYYQNHYVWDIDTTQKEVAVNFVYDNVFPFYFEVTPRDGNTLRSGMSGGSDLLDTVCLQMWKFTYDVMYPISVEVIDETTNYVFRTAFTVHVKRNRADRSGEVLAPSAQQIEFSDEEKYCQKRDVPMTIYTYELVENSDTGVYWREPVEGVGLSYTCLKYKCSIGETEYGFSGLGHVAAYKTNFPYCAGGILRGAKEGYMENWERVVANNRHSEAELNLIPVFKVHLDKIKVIKHEFDSLEGLEQGELDESKLEKEEIVSIKIKRNKEEWGPYENTAIVSLDMDEQLLEESYLEFLGETDFEYEVEVYLMDGAGIKGGYKNNWTVNWQELMLSDEIVFHILSKDSFSNDLELFDFVGNMEEYSRKNSLVLEPEIK